MPIGLRTPTAPPVKTHHETPEGLDPEREWFEILSYLDESVLKAAQAAALKTIVQGNRTRQEQDEAAFSKSLFDSQLKGWQLEVPADWPFDPELMTNDGAVVHWKFNQTTIAAVLGVWDARNWLQNRILSCGGVVATAGLVVRTDSGQTLDYKSPPTGVDDQQGTGQVSDPVGNAPLAESAAGA